MPYSHSWQIDAIVNVIRAFAPKSLLDVGTGRGMYGFLARHYLEAQSEWEGVASGRPRIDGIEGYSKYVDSPMRTVYDDITVADISSTLPQIADCAYEMVLLVDVLEHFDRSLGEQVLQHCRRISELVLVSTPNGFSLQEGGDNPYQTHRSYWSRGDLTQAGAHTVVRNDYSHIALIPGGPKGRMFCSRWQCAERRRRAHVWKLRLLTATGLRRPPA